MNEAQENNSTEVQVIEAEEVQLVPMDSGERSEIEMQVATARKFPRSLKGFKDQAMSMATLDEETAASCFYVLPRGGKKVEGPGIRLAEIAALSWGNLRYGARTVGETDDRRSIIAEGFAHDLQTNNRVSIRVQRRITDRHGKRYNDDMIAVTGNAACSIALRNAVFKIIPMTYINSVYEAAKKLAVGDATSLVDRREKAMAHFAKFGIVKERVLARVGKKSIEDIDLTDLELLVGLTTAMKDGELSADEAFPKVEDSGEKPKTLFDKVKSKAEEKQTTETVL